MHKGFKCLDISSGRIYISRYVVFDEEVFPFSLLHPNAEALLPKEIVLLQNHLLNPGDVSCVTNVANGFEDNCDDIQELKKIRGNTMVKLVL